MSAYAPKYFSDPNPLQKYRQVYIYSQVYLLNNWKDERQDNQVVKDNKYKLANQTPTVQFYNETEIHMEVVRKLIRSC